MFDFIPTTQTIQKTIQDFKEKGGEFSISGIFLQVKLNERILLSSNLNWYLSLTAAS